MKIKEVKSEGLSREYNVTVSAADFTAEVDKKLHEIAKTVSMAKHATMHDYRHATGFEALMGYLYLTDRFDRLVSLIKEAADGLHLRL